MTRIIQLDRFTNYLPKINKIPHISKLPSLRIIVWLLYTQLVMESCLSITFCGGSTDLCYDIMGCIVV